MRRPRGTRVTCDTTNPVTCSSHKCDAKMTSLVAVQPLKNKKKWWVGGTSWCLGTSTPLGFPGGWDKGLGDLGLGQGVRGLGVRGASATMNIGWNIMMCGCKHTFRVSWGLGHGVRGLGVREASGHGTLSVRWSIMMCGCKDTFRVSWGLGQGVRGLGVGTRG